MSLHSACRALLCGATLLAVTATAAPDNAQPANSPCLDHQPAPANTPQPAAPKPRSQWFSPCYLADAEKKDDEHEDAVDTVRKNTLQRLDDIDLLGRRGPAASNDPALPWTAPAGLEYSYVSRQPDAGEPAGWHRHQPPLQAGGGTHGMLPAGDARADAAIPAVPEPANVVLLAAGLAVLAGVARRRHRR